VDAHLNVNAIPGIDRPGNLYAPRP
jgi:hypothetical protein